MVPAEFQSESGLGDETFRLAVWTQHADPLFFDFVAHTYSAVAGSTIVEKMANLTADQWLPLLDEGDDWYRAQVDGLGSPGSLTAGVQNALSGKVADETFWYVLANQLVVSYAGAVYLGPNDPLTRPIGLLAVHLANTVAFREWCGLEADDPLAADKLLLGRNGFLQRIYWPTLENEKPIGELPAMPLAVLSWPRAQTGQGMTVAEDMSHGYSGQIKVLLLDWNPSGRQAYHVGGQLFGFKVGRLWKELFAVDRENDHLAITRITVNEPPFLPIKSEEAQHGKAWWAAELLVYYGDEQGG